MDDNTPGFIPPMTQDEMDDMHKLMEWHEGTVEDIVDRLLATTLLDHAPRPIWYRMVAESALRMAREELLTAEPPKKHLVVVDDVYNQEIFIVGFDTETEAEIFRARCRSMNLDASVRSVHPADSEWIERILVNAKVRYERYGRGSVA